MAIKAYHFLFQSQISTSLRNATSSWWMQKTEPMTVEDTMRRPKISIKDRAGVIWGNLREVLMVANQKIFKSSWSRQWPPWSQHFIESHLVHLNAKLTSEIFYICCLNHSVLERSRVITSSLLATQNSVFVTTFVTFWKSFSFFAFCLKSFFFWVLERSQQFVHIVFCAEINFRQLKRIQMKRRFKETFYGPFCFPSCLFRLVFTPHFFFAS